MERGAIVQMTLKLKDLVNLDFLKSLKFTKYNPEDKFIGGGVYRLYNDKKKIIYIGKSKNLADRLYDHHHGNTHTAYFHEEIKHADWYRTNSPIFQTMLEGILIAFYKPRYNDEVKDEKEMKHGKNKSKQR